MSNLKPFPATVFAPTSAEVTAKALVEAQVEMEQLITTLLLEPQMPSQAGWSRSGAVYLILSSRQALRERYGEEGFRLVDDALKQLQLAVSAHVDLNALLVYVDEAASLAPYGLQPVDATHPWKIKGLIESLDAFLKTRKQALRYILIVGGDAIIPFHRLPNPINDQDADVPSDNPYASQDANYFIPERAIGRLPDGQGEPVTVLLQLLEEAISAHRRKAATDKGAWTALLRHLRGDGEREDPRAGLGYSASIWRKASRQVLQTLGDRQPLRISPPLTYQEFKPVRHAPFSYFNLHGIEDGPNWYGQRDALFPATYELFPVALRPEDLRPADYAGAIVFSEACYGANILSKNSDASLALKFLAARARAVIGSTKVSYGTVAPPLIGADLLARYFWKGLLAQLPIGEALKYAKVSLAREMQERQGYLDSEDQKTLLSFVLYGDPALPGLPDGNIELVSKALCPPLVYQRQARDQKSLLSESLVAAVKGRIEASLPYLAEARVQAVPVILSESEPEMSRAKSRGSRRPVARWAFTLEKDFPIEGDGAHRQVVTVTVDEHGAILKAVMSK